MLFQALKPMLLQTGKESELPELSTHTFDVKWDGWRILLHKYGERVEAFSRHGTNVTSRFPELIEAGRSIKEHTAILDTEGVVIRQGISVFDDFAYRGRLTNQEKIEQATITHPVTFVAFDVLATNKEHIHEPLTERKKRLSSIITPSPQLQVTPSIQGNGMHIFQMTREKGMEGIVGKRSDSPYQLNQRSDDWKKFKHFKITEAVILGYKENPFRLIVGQRLNNGTYKAIANIEFGFNADEKMAFRQIAKQIITKQQKDVFWVEPRLCCNVQYLEKSTNGMLRIASFKGFNFDKNPEDCLIS